MCCITGALHEGTPKGTEGTIAGLPTYIAKPPASSATKAGIIVIITDAFGWDFINNRLLADTYAEKSGRTVYVPDFMSGNFPAWLLCSQLTPGRRLWRPMVPYYGRTYRRR